MNINTIHVCGRITKDIELKALPSGQQIAGFCIATNHSYTTKEKEKKESTEFHNIILFGKQAENASKYLITVGSVT